MAARSSEFASNRQASYLALIGCCVVTGSVYGASLPTQAEDLFRSDRLWNVHLTVAQDQWEKMEPKGGGGPMGGPPRGPGGGRPPGGGGGGFGPGMFIGPAFLEAGDSDKDGKLSKQEFLALGTNWFGRWDSNSKGTLSSDQLRDGLNRALAPSDGPQRGPGPGMNLQGPEGKRNGLASALGIEFEQVHADLEFEGEPIKDVSLRYKGNGTFLESRGSEKRSMKVDLNHFVKGQKLAGVTQLNFHNSITDPSWMNEVLSHRLFRDSGVPAPRTAYAKVYVTVPGTFSHHYLGLYSMVEDVGRAFVKERFQVKGGALFKPVTSTLFKDLGTDWAKYNQTYDPIGDLTPAQSGRVIEFSQLVTHGSDEAFAAKLGEFIDLAEFSRYMAVMVWLSDLDGILGPGQNFYLYLHPKSDRFSFIPWDQDHSFGQFGMRGTQEQREHLSIHKPWQGENRFLDRVFKTPAFKSVYLAALKELTETQFQPDRFRAQVDQLAEVLRPAVKEESEEKLSKFDKVVAGESVSGGGFRGGGPPRGEGPDGGRPPGPPGNRGEGPGRGGFPGGGGAQKPIKAFVEIRARSVADQLAGKETGQTLDEFGPGGPPGGRGRGGFGQGNFLGPAFLTALDANRDSGLSREEFTNGFAKWFENWNTDKSGSLTPDQLAAGINRDLAPMPPDDGPPPPP